MDKFYLVVSDTHVMHACGLAPAGFLLSTGNVLQVNRGQSYLLDCWSHFLDSVPAEYDALIINGDATEGKNPVVDAVGVCENDQTFQARAAVELIKPLATRARKTYLTRGTQYHVGPAGRNEEILGQGLSAVPDEYGRYVHTWLQLWANPYVLLDIAHKQSLSVVQSTPLYKEVEFFLTRVARSGFPTPEMTVIVRSHTHGGFRLYEEEHVMAISTPGWKLQDDYAKTSNSPNRLTPDNIGSVGIRVLDEPVDGSYIQIVRYLYEHPEAYPRLYNE